MSVHEISKIHQMAVEHAQALDRKHERWAREGQRLHEQRVAEEAREQERLSEEKGRVVETQA